METSPHPSFLWRLFVVVGVGTMTALSVDDAAWERWRATFGDRLTRPQVRNLLAGTVAVHAAEAGVTWRRARRAGLPDAGRWAFANFLWGFPVMARLRRAVPETGSLEG